MKRTLKTLRKLRREEADDPRAQLPKAVLEDMFDRRWTPKQRLFALSYLRHRNGSRAVREAYPEVSLEAGSSFSWELRNKPHIKAFITERDRSEQERLKVDAERVIEGYAKVATFNLADLLVIDPVSGMPAGYDLNEATREQLDAVAKVKITEKTTTEAATGNVIVTREVELAAHPKVSALDSLAKHFKLLGSDTTISIEFDIAERVNEAKRRAREMLAERHQQLLIEGKIVDER